MPNYIAVIPRRKHVLDSRALATRAEVAQFLGVPPGTLTQWAHRGVGPKYTRVGRHARYSWSDVEHWLERQNTGGSAA
jgi:excisionase family DNA binding protein